jgi:hypothetical protein
MKSVVGGDALVYVLLIEVYSMRRVSRTGVQHAHGTESANYTGFTDE